MKEPYYAVIFTSTRTPEDNGYTEMADKMVELATQQTGFLGVESAREKIGITVSYWESASAIANWKKDTDHLFAQQLGIENWYSWYKVRVCLVQREYEFEK